jgi:sterol 14alpha-demethylase
MNESVSVLGNDNSVTSQFSFDTVNQLDVAHRCMKESLRQYPPLIMLMRAVHEPFNVNGYTVPKGHYVFTSPAVSMNLPNGSKDQVFPNPEKFDPDRYLPERAEDRLKPFGYSAFGGGMHGCLGEQFGFLQVKTIVEIVLRKYELTPVGKLPGPDYRAMVVGPHRPTKVHYKKRSSNILSGPFVPPTPL